jgi:hypothetical protein
VPADAGANWSFGAVHPSATPMHAHRAAHEPLGDFAHAHLHGAMADELGPAGGAAGPSSIWSRPPMMGPPLGFSGGMQPLQGAQAQQAQAGQVVRVEWYSAAEREVRAVCVLAWRSTRPCARACTAHAALAMERCFVVGTARRLRSARVAGERQAGAPDAAGGHCGRHHLLRMGRPIRTGALTLSTLE